MIAVCRKCLQSIHNTMRRQNIVDILDAGQVENPICDLCNTEISGEEIYYISSYRKTINEENREIDLIC